MFSAEKNKQKIFTIGIGGAAGDGVRDAGNNLAAILGELGFEVFHSFNYPSVIRGSHNFSRISFSDGPIANDYEKIDLLVAITDETVKIHLKELSDKSVVLSENFTAEENSVLGNRATILPFLKAVREFNLPIIARSSLAIGAIVYLLDLPAEKTRQIFEKLIGERAAEANLKLFDRGEKEMTGISTLEKGGLPAMPSGGKKEVWEGNAAFARGLVRAGLEFYIAYPMTPSSSALHFLAKNQKDFGIKVIQPEDEITVINMALGVAYAGKRVAIGSATGGFALMQEGLSLAGVSETPIVILVSQRQGPATGVPTHTSQADLKFVINAGHGEFPKIVIAPGDIEEAFLAGSSAMNLAWQYQLPVIVLMDKHISEGMKTVVSLPPNNPSREEAKLADKNTVNYGRYQMTDDGISPLAFPGTPDFVIKTTSYEHDEKGLTVDEGPAIKAMQDKRFLKKEHLQKNIGRYETVKISGDAGSKNAVLFWGSTKGAVVEAAKYFKKDARLVQILWLEPLDSEKIKESLAGAENIIVVEANRTNQLAGLIREKTGLNPRFNINRYDAEPFEPTDLADKINSLLI